MTTRARNNRRTAVVAAAIATSLVFADTALAVDDQPDRERFGTDDAEEHVNPGDGEVITTSTPTLVVESDVDGTEIVIVDDAGHAAGSSGAIDDDQWRVEPGTLHAGARYEWAASAPSGGVTVGSNNPVIDHDLDAVEPMVFGTRIIDHHEVQGPQAFSVATGVGAITAANGLMTDFFPHFDISEQMTFDEDGNPIDDLPPSVVPGPGSEMVSETATWLVLDDEAKLCPLEERAPRPPNDQQPPPPIVYEVREWTMCELEFAVEAEATVTAGGGEAAAHNIVGHNVAPSFSMTVTSDQSVDDGFVLSTAGDERVSAAFPLQTEFGFRSLGYLEVPESGTYRFGTQSPGGAQLHVYDTTEADIGKIEVSDPDAWTPTTLGESYYAKTDLFEFENNETGSSTSQDMNWLYRSRHYEYAHDDFSWFQATGKELRQLAEDLREDGPRADVVRWGDDIELEAGRLYPIAFTGWLGPINGEFGIHVDGPSTSPQPVPFDWLTAAPAGTVDFDRGMNATDLSDIGGVSLAMSGHGDVLAALDADGTLRFYDSDGGYGWDETATLDGIGNVIPKWTQLDYDVNVDDSNVALQPFDEVSGPVAVDVAFDQIRVTAGPLEFTNAEWDEPASIDHLDVVFDNKGNFVSGDVAGRAPSGVDGDHWVDVTDVYPATTFDVDTGRIDVHTGNPNYLPWAWYMHYFVLEPSEVEPTPGAWGMAFDDVGTTLVVAPDRRDPVAEQALHSYDVFATRELLTGWITSREGVPAVRVDGPVATLVDEFSLGVTLFPPGLDLDATVHISSASFEFDDDDRIINGVASGSVNVGETTRTISEVRGRRNPQNDRLLLDFVVRDDDKESLFGMTLDETDFEILPPATNVDAFDVALIDKVDGAAGWSEDNTDIVWVNDLLDDAGRPRPTNDRGAMVQAVQITPDGNTVAVLQPHGESYRVVVVDRDDRDADWTIAGVIGTQVHEDLTRMSADIPVAVGRDGDRRFLAIGNGKQFSVREWTPGGAWTVTERTPTKGSVTSLSFDYWSEHLAVGQPDVGRVSIYERPWSSSEWSLHSEIDAAEGFGSQVAYTWGLLTVADAERGVVRVYRDTGIGSWSSYGDWVETAVDGLGTGLLFNSGGSSVRVRAATTSIVVGNTFERLWGPYQHGLALGAFGEIGTHAA